MLSWFDWPYSPGKARTPHHNRCPGHSQLYPRMVHDAPSIAHLMQAGHAPPAGGAWEFCVAKSLACTCRHSMRRYGRRWYHLHRAGLHRGRHSVSRWEHGSMSPAARGPARWARRACWSCARGCPGRPQHWRASCTRRPSAAPSAAGWRPSARGTARRCDTLCIRRCSEQGLTCTDQSLSEARCAFGPTEAVK